jgi:hypothetical protein
VISLSNVERDVIKFLLGIWVQICFLVVQFRGSNEIGLAIWYMEHCLFYSLCLVIDGRF